MENFKRHDIRKFNVMKGLSINAQKNIKEKGLMFEFINSGIKFIDISKE
jgi:hypothetical protein